MIPMIIFIVILGLIWVKADRIGDKIGCTVVLFIAGSFLLIICSVPSKVRDGTYPVEIVQLKSRDSVGMSGGGSFLGWHIRDGVPQYVVMEVRNGGMIRTFLPQDKTYIIESDLEPKVLYRAYKQTCPKWRSLPFLWKFEVETYKRDFAVIHVPAGTVINKYEPIQ